MFGIGVKEILMLLVVLVLCFGLRRLPLLGRSLGGSVQEFRRSVHQFGCEAGRRDASPGEEEKP